MAGPKILVIEDNPFARQVARDTLESAGFVVLEAENGKSALGLAAREAPQLVLLDLALPDGTGPGLVARLRELSAPATPPIVAYSGEAAGPGELRGSLPGFTELLEKPFEGGQLLRIVQAYLPGSDLRVAKPGGGRRIVLAEDDPDQSFLTARHLQLAGFAVTRTADGAEALEHALATPPDAVVSDILMPRLDGFQLCLKIRQHAELKTTPVILVTNNYLEPEDRELARKVGASGYVTRMAGLEAVVLAVLAGLDAQATRPALESAPELDAQHVHRVMRQLERQARMNLSMAKRCSLQATALSVLGRLTDAMAGTRELPAALGELLTQCAETVGIALLVVYLAEAGRNRLSILARSRAGDAEPPSARADLLQRALASRALASVPSSAGADAAEEDFLAASRGRSAILAPFAPDDDCRGIVLLVSRSPELTTSDWLSFARTLSAQIGLGITLARAFGRLAASDQRNRSVLESARDGILVLDPAGKVVEANRRSEEILGRPRAGMMGCDCAELLITPDAGASETRFGEVLRARLGTAPNVDLRRADGSGVQVDFTLTPVPVRGETLHLASLHDVTERNQLEQELRQAQKMEAMGRLAGGVAHDFNNMLTAILGFVELSLRGLHAPETARTYLLGAKQAGEHAASLTSQLLAFSRRQVVQPQVLDLNEAIAKAGRMLGRLIGENIELATIYREKSISVTADPGQLEQILINLVVNARDAMPNGGRITIETSEVASPENVAHAQRDLGPGPFVKLSVSDTGVGMDEETTSRVFEPFFTTKEPGKGTGLGLSTVYGIVRQSGGAITFRSRKGAGTTFSVYLPRASAEAATLGPQDVPAPGARVSEVVLVVEDDPAVREVTAQYLRDKGYTVLLAAQGQEALTLAAAFSGRIDVLLTDVLMPGMGGRKLADRLLVARPEVRIIYMSGHADDTAILPRLRGAGSAFLQKPFSLEALAGKVREVLDAPQRK
ncbi:MAG: response regulator [Planctomycetes bacterium]|nr:response regulator [Planctomycetota bacterium]